MNRFLLLIYVTANDHRMLVSVLIKSYYDDMTILENSSSSYNNHSLAVDKKHRPRELTLCSQSHMIVIQAQLCEPCPVLLCNPWQCFLLMQSGVGVFPVFW